MYIAGSTLSSLGYHKGKSYGVTYSTYDRETLGAPKLSRPTGSIVGSTFTDIYYGFYSYEADDIAIVGNTYVNNVIYGIDPHDSSRRLIIAGNETYGSGKKHGIIVSRNVDNSWIFNNYSHHNHGSGIMLDRGCNNNVITNNISAYNDGDGLTLFESPNNFVSENKIYQNGLGGIRIRNSWDIHLLHDQLSDNAGVPIIIYTDALTHAPHENRDLNKDPYSTKAEVTIARSVIKQQGRKPVIKISGIDSLSLSDLDLLSGNSVFSDPLFPDETFIRQNIGVPDKRLIIVKKM
jgi:poly(beta-D-mannuronate) C5 epimerase